MPTSPEAQSRRQSLLILGIILVGAGLRLYTIQDGLPYFTGPDEPVIVRDGAVTMMQSGTLRPPLFDYGGLIFYIHMAIACVRFLWGAMNLEWTKIDDVSVWAGPFYLWSRVATALISTFTIYIVYRAADRWGPRVAIIAAATMALHPMLSREAHFALTDTPLTFFVAMTLLLSLCAAETGQLRWFLMAGAAAGLAAAIKYNGIVAVMMPLVAVVTVTSVRERAAVLFGTIGVTILAFGVGAPYSFLDFKSFLNGFAELITHYNREPGVTPTWEIYVKHMADWFTFVPARSDPHRLSAWPAGILCLIGFLMVAAGVFRRHIRAAALSLLLFPIAYFWFVQKSLIFARYLMPLVPALCIVLAVGMVASMDWLGQRNVLKPVRRLIPALLLLVIVPLGIDAVSWDLQRRFPSPALVATRWLMDNVKPEELVIVEGMEVMFQLPPMYKVNHVNGLVDSPLEQYRKDGAVYLVSSSLQTEKFLLDPPRFPAQVKAYNAMLAGTQWVKTFAPGPGTRDGSTIMVFRILR